MIATVSVNTLPDQSKFIMFLIAYLIVGFGVFRSLSEGLFRKKLLLDHLLIILATIGAFGVGRYPEGVFVMLLFELGLIFEAVSMDWTKRSIAHMLDVRPVYAVRRVGEKEIKVEPSDLQPNDIIIIKPGEKIPADAVITSGTTTVDMKALTGEAMPQPVSWGDKIYSGCINLSGVIDARVIKSYEDSTVYRIMDLVEKAQNNKAESEAFTAKFSRVYTPIMFVCAILVMLLPPMTFSYGNWSTWIYRGLTFMVVACPCGLVMSVPMAFLGGIASAARQGIVIKGGNYLEALAKADTFVFDKTGTLTEGTFKVKKIYAEEMPEEELLAMVAHVENYSRHPIAHSLLDAYQGEMDVWKVHSVQELPGYGISAIYEGRRVYIGNWRMLEYTGVDMEEIDTAGTVVYVVVGDRYAGRIVLSDVIKEDTRFTMSYLKERCKAVLVMLTGDTRNAAIEVAEELHMDYAYANLMPEDKLEQLEDFLFLQDDTEKLVCVGDGINDAPILARADVGIAMGNLGSAAAVEAADVILLEDDLSKIIDALHIAKETLHAVKQNIFFALFIKCLVVILAIVGYFGMWEAILVEVGVMVVAAMNAAWVVKYAA